MKKTIYILITVLVILFITFFVANINVVNLKNKNTDTNLKIYETTCGKYEKRKLEISGKELLVDIADNECKMSLGLSWKASLIDEGMLVVFENVGNYSFWMKDMNFPIDILWINENLDVVGIEKNLSPDTFPKSFGSNYLVKYVLEVPAQYSDKNNIKTGDKIVFTTK